MKTKRGLQKVFFWIVGMALLVSPSVHAATFVVNNTGDGGDDSSDGICEANTGSGDCTLRAAIGESNDDNSVDVITFDPAVFPAGAGTTISTTSVLNLNAPVTITGPGASSLTVSNDGSSRVFFIDHLAFLTPAGPHEISGMTITGGAGGIHVSHIEEDVILNSLAVSANTLATDDGGGIRIGGLSVAGPTIFIRNSTIDGNTTTAAGGGIGISGDATVEIQNTTISGNTAGDDFNDHGGGIFNSGGSSTLVENSTLFNNFAGDSGGGIGNSDADSEVTVTNSTLSDNSSQGDGGGIFNNGSASNTVTLLNVTVTDNTSDINVNATGEGGGLAQQNGAGTLTVTNSIVAGNTDNTPAAADDCFTDTDDASDVVSGGNNFIGDIVGCGDNTFDTSATKNDQVGDSGGSGALDPLLAALDPTDGGNPANGGVTAIHLPLNGSPVIDAVDESIAAAPEDDQRGTTRPIGDAADIGAAEAGCGNGIIETGEECDDGGESAECDDDCTAVSCGDGNENGAADEDCDDGNTTAEDGCSSTCTEEDSGGCSLIRS